MAPKHSFVFFVKINTPCLLQLKTHTVMSYRSSKRPLYTNIRGERKNQKRGITATLSRDLTRSITHSTETDRPHSVGKT